MLLENQVALVTGAASGIGRASAQLFAREGAKVVVADVRETKSLATVESIRAAGGEAIFVRTDVGKMDETQRLVQATLSHFGRLDVLHSNAAAYAMGSTTAISEADWDRTLDVCLKATWMLAYHAVPVMLDQGKGVIVVTGSNHAIRGYPDYAAYQAAKGGLLALTRSLAADYAPTIRANAILPGAVVTDLWDESTEDDQGDAAADESNADEREATDADGGSAEVGQASNDRDVEGGMIELIAEDASIDLPNHAYAAHDGESIGDSEVRMEAGVALLRIFDLATTPGGEVSADSASPPPAERAPDGEKSTAEKPVEASNHGAAMTSAGLLMAVPFSIRRPKRDDESEKSRRR